MSSQGLKVKLVLIICSDVLTCTHIPPQAHHTIPFHSLNYWAPLKNLLSSWFAGTLISSSTVIVLSCAVFPIDFFFSQSGREKKKQLAAICQVC